MEDQFKLTVGPPKAFPMNGFARVGDIMQVPYIGSYVIVEVQVPLVAGTPPTLIEVNSVTMDAAFAEDTDISDDLDGQKYPEDIGRFVPMLPEVSAGPSFAPDLSSVAHVTGTMDSSGLTSFDDVLRTEKPGFWNNCDVIVYNTDQSATATWRRQFRSVTNSNLGTIKVNSAFNPALLANVRYIYKIQAPRYSHYGWAGDLPDYFTTIHAPADDYTPNVDPLVVAVPPKPKPDPVKNLSDPARATNRIGFVPPPGISTGPTEDDVPVEGLININIAGWKVLSALPLVMKRNPPPAPATIDVNLSENLAKRIVYFRDIDDGTGTPTNPHPHGPFKSIMELCLVPNFVSGEGTIRLSTIPNENPGIDLGDYSPLTQDPRGDNVRLDFKEKYLTLTRISNLITLRSDCFTVYLQVQGWQDAGSANAKLMVQRRLAFIVDRSRVTPLKPTPTVFNVQVPPSGR